MAANCKYCGIGNYHPTCAARVCDADVHADGWVVDAYCPGCKTGGDGS